MHRIGSIVLVGMIIFVAFSPRFSAALPVINEVMPHSNNAWGDEWIELYNPTNNTLILSGWNISDISSNDTISLNISAYGFGLIVDNNTRVGNATGCSAFNISNMSCVKLTAIGNGLNNTGESVFLFNSSSVRVDNFSWVYDIQSNGTSWGRNPDGVTNWTVCTPTPGYANNCTTDSGNSSNTSTQNIILSVYIGNISILNVTYDDLFKIEIDDKTSCSVQDNVTALYNITSVNGTLVFSGNFTRQVGCSGYANTGEWTPNATGNFTLCGVISNSTVNETNFDDNAICGNISVVDPNVIVCNLGMSINANLDTVAGQSILLNQSTNTSLSYNLVINDTTCNSTEHPLLVTYWIEDLYGSYGREPANSSTTITCSKPLSRSWTPDDVTGSETYIIKANITNAYCNDSSLSNNYAERLVVVAGNGSSGSNTNSSISITSVSQGSDNSSKWGESFDVWLDIYRGNTSKYSVSVYVNGTASTTNEVSEQTTVHASDKFTNYKLKVPVQLKPNCDGDWPDGIYELVVSGLNIIAKYNVSISEISSSTCETVTVSTGSGGGGGYYTSTQSTAQQTQQTVSQSEKTGEDANFYFITFPASVDTGKQFDVVVNIKNNKTITQTFTVYSYVFDGNKLISDGKDENGTWQKTWDANAITIALASGMSKNVTLVNRIKSTVSAGTYKLRVRIKDVKDLTKTIIVNEGEVTGEESASGDEDYSDELTTSANQTTRQRRIIIRKNPVDMVKRFLGDVINEFSNITEKIARFAFSRMPKSDPLAMSRITGRLFDGFIWQINQIIPS